MIKIIKGDLLDADETVIAHQCNCTTRSRASGVARAIFETYAYSEAYISRTEDDAPGTYSARWRHEERGPTVVNLYSQLRPGKANYSDDSAEKRLRWFEESLGSFLREFGPDKVAIPYLIGCGLAGGHWPTYEALLEKISKDNDVPFTLYRLE